MNLTRTWRGSAALVLLLALIVGMFVGGTSRGAAQDDANGDGDPEGRPVSVVAGGCDGDEAGEVVAALNDLTPAEGDAVGQENPSGLAETSFTNVELTLDDLLADDHAVVAGFAADDDEPLVCGEIGGILDETGSLVVGLRQQNESGFTGIAFFADADDGATTNVSVFIAQTDGARSPAGRVAAPDAATPGAAVGATPVVASAATGSPAEAEPETVDVSLIEFAIDMETALDDGPFVFEVTNDGTIRHGFAVEGEGVEAALDGNLQPGESATLEVELPRGSYTVYSPTGRDRDRGMERELTVR